MIVDVASEKLAICHWVVDGRKNEGVFDVRSLEWYRTGQQHALWPDSNAPYQLVDPAHTPSRPGTETLLDKSTSAAHSTSPPT